MAFTMSGSFDLPADPDTVWRGLNDPAVLQSCIPGCESLERISDEELKARAVVKLGPVKAGFNGKIRLEDVNPPTSYTLRGEGEGGIAGFAKGAAKVRLEPIEIEGRSATRLGYEVEAAIGGKLAQLGGRLVNGAAKQMADSFFTRFSNAIAPGAAVPAVEGEAAKGA